MSKSSLLPKKFRCKECGSEFIITGDEQEFFRRNKLSLPKRCKQCRSIKKWRVYIE
jgi:hypothetical protein